MAKLATVGREITAQAHRVRFLADHIIAATLPDRDFKIIEELRKTLRSLEDDLESINLERLIQKYNKRGLRINQEDRRHYIKREGKKLRQKNIKEVTEKEIGINLFLSLADHIQALGEGNYLSKIQTKALIKIADMFAEKASYLPEFQDEEFLTPITTTGEAGLNQSNQLSKD